MDLELRSSQARYGRLSDGSDHRTIVEYWWEAILGGQSYVVTQRSETAPEQPTDLRDLLPIEAILNRLSELAAQKDALTGLAASAAPKTLRAINKEQLELVALLT